MHSGKKVYGSVSMNLPLSHAVLLSGVALIVLISLVYACTVDFTSMYIVKGFLNAKLGVARVYSVRTGIISRKFVTVGQAVPIGAALFLVDTTADAYAYAMEEALLHKRLLRLEHNIQAKRQYLHVIQPLLAKHYLAASTYQTFRDHLSALETSRHDLKMAILHHKNLHEYVIRAPIAGTISSLEAYVGQKVNDTQSLLTILPDQAELVAQVYVPVAKSGFLQAGSELALRYDAYPYQHFGFAKARIKSISTSILNDRDEDKPIQIGEPYYKVIAYLGQQYIVASGKKHALQQGMTCSAVLPGAHKKLWRWIFDPIHHYGIT